MENRFTIKDFIFAVLIILVLGAVIFASYQFNYQEQRLNDVKKQLQAFDESQKTQLQDLADIKKQLKNGVAMTGPAATLDANDGRIRRTNPDGSIYVYYPTPPKPPRDPHDFADYAPGDWLVDNLGDEPKSIAPYTEKDYYGQLAQAPVMESLLTRNSETFEWEPLLAESYEIKPDGLIFIFKLREGLQFSDGVPVTADDVLFSFNTLRNPDVDCAPLRGYYQHVKALTKIDARTVKFEFDEPYFKAIDIAGGMLILPQHVYKFTTGEEYNKRGDLLVGTGPYLLSKWERGTQLVMVRNDHYWGERPTFDRIVMKFIKNPQAALQSFQDGQLDIFNPNPEQWVKFTADTDFMKHTTAYKYSRPDSGYGFIGYNEKRPQFTDKETRKALTMLLDRDAIIHSFLKDMAVPIAGPFNPLVPQNDPSIKPLPYDPEQAKAVLAKAGWKPAADGTLERNGVKFEFDLMMGTGNPLTERIAAYVQDQWKQAGIKMHVTPFEFATLGERLDDRKFDAVFMAWSADLEDDPYQIWDSASMADKGSNFISFDNKESDKLIEETRKLLDDKARMDGWHRWQALIYDEQPYTFLDASVSRVFISDRFKNTQPYKTGIAQYDWFVPAGTTRKYHQ